MLWLTHALAQERSFTRDAAIRALLVRRAVLLEYAKGLKDKDWFGKQVRAVHWVDAAYRARGSALKSRTQTLPLSTCTQDPYW